MEGQERKRRYFKKPRTVQCSDEQSVSIPRRKKRKKGQRGAPRPVQSMDSEGHIFIHRSVNEAAKFHRIPRGTLNKALTLKDAVTIRNILFKIPKREKLPNHEIESQPSTVPLSSEEEESESSEGEFLDLQVVPHFHISLPSLLQ